MSDQTRRALAELTVAYRADLPDATISLYLRELADLPDDVLERAVSQIIRTKRESWFPTIGEIRAVAAELVLALPGEADALGQVEARLAWGILRQGDPPDVHPLVREALDHAGGFKALRHSESPTVVRGQMMAYYRDLRARAIRDAQVAPALPPAPERRAIGP